MSRYVFSKEAENDLVETYRYGFINYGENKANGMVRLTFQTASIGP